MVDLVVHNYNKRDFNIVEHASMQFCVIELPPCTDDWI